MLSKPKGFVIVDNNAGFLTMKYDLNGSQILDTVPIDSIVD